MKINHPNLNSLYNNSKQLSSNIKSTSNLIVGSDIRTNSLRNTPKVNKIFSNQTKGSTGLLVDYPINDITKLEKKSESNKIESKFSKYKNELNPVNRGLHSGVIGLSNKNIGGYGYTSSLSNFGKDLREVKEKEKAIVLPNINYYQNEKNNLNEKLYLNDKKSSHPVTLFENNKYGYKQSKQEDDEIVDKLYNINKLKEQNQNTSISSSITALTRNTSANGGYRSNSSIKQPTQSNSLISNNPISSLDITSKYQNKKQIIEYIGLSNLGNTCYMNTALQVLLNCDLFIKSLLKSTIYNKNGVTREFIKLSEEYISQKSNSSYYKQISPKDFKRTFDLAHRQFSGYNQHDCQEFMRVLLEDISSETNIAPKTKFKELDDTGKSKEQFKAEYKVFYDNREKSVVTEFFFGELVTVFVCENCRNETYSFQKFMDIPLYLSKFFLK